MSNGNRRHAQDLNWGFSADVSIFSTAAKTGARSHQLQQAQQLQSRKPGR